MQSYRGGGSKCLIVAIPCCTELGLVPCIGTLNILGLYSYLKTVPPSHSQCQAVVAMRCYAAERCSLTCLPPSQMHLQDSIRLIPHDHKAAVCNQETAAATPAMDITYQNSTLISRAFDIFENMELRPGQ